MVIIQDLKYEVQEIMIEEGDLNSLGEWIGTTEEKMMQFYHLGRG